MGFPNEVHCELVQGLVKATYEPCYAHEPSLMAINDTSLKNGINRIALQALRALRVLRGENAGVGHHGGQGEHEGGGIGDS